MLNNLRTTAVFGFLVIWGGCGQSSNGPAQQTSGEFSLLTYNVAGLPQGVSSSNPEENIPRMSSLLNSFDVVLVQEDFFYHDELKSEANHTFKSEPKAMSSQFTSGDGLNRFSILPFRSFFREPWDTCSNENGNDCLAAKGFSVAETEIAVGVFVDIYNLHMDAGGQLNDFSARSSQVSQLLRTINARSVGRAIIVAGDLNLNLVERAEDVGIFQTLIDGADLTDVCQSMSCTRDLVDKVLFRGSDSLRIEAISWETDSQFVDEDGVALSDHEAVVVRIAWERVAQ
jgi:endonuclease/exonuclease/phosphatase family metal-dependent hydrolase